MRIGIAGPVSICAIREHLDVPAERLLPNGLGSTPIVTLVRGLLRRGHDLTVFTLDLSVTEEVIVSGERLKLCVGPYRSHGRARDFFSVERKYLSDSIRRENPDVVHAHWTYEFALGSLATRLPVLVTAHDSPFRILRFMPDPYRIVRTAMACRVAQVANTMTAVSNHVAEDFRKLGYRGQMEVVPNALDASTFRTRQSRVIDSFPRGCRPIFATALSGWSRLKNGKTALLAFGKVRSVLKNAELWMFGPQYGVGEEAELWARKHYCDLKVSFRGATPHREMLSTMAEQVDVIVHPAREESFGMVAAEAMALGIPFIGGEDAGGLPEVVEYGTCGVLVNAGSADDLAQAMIRLVADRQFYKCLGERARRSAEGRFEECLVAAEYERLLGKVS